jgi:hypothetical protein
MQACMCLQAARSVAGALGALRRHMLERAVPVLATLKGTLEEAKHPLQRDALHCLVRLWLEHPADMDELLVTRVQLASEIKFQAQVRASRSPPSP